MENFQSHARTALKFVPGVNVIIGPSDSGKTTVIRALRWLTWNRPSGEAFRSHWGGATRVTISIDNNKFIISRFRDKSKNFYFLDGLDQPVKFEAIGTNIPAEICAALGLNEINLQMQLDRPFLLDASPNEVAQHFDHVTHLDVINCGVQNVQKWARAIEQEIKSEEQHLIQLQENLLQYAYLDEMEEHVSAIERVDQDRISLQNQIMGLDKCISEIKNLEREITEHSGIIKVEVHVNTVLSAITQKKKLEDEESVLSRQVAQLMVLDDQLRSSSKEIKLEQPVKTILGFIEKRNELVGSIEALGKDLNSFDAVAKSLNEMGTLLGKLEKEFKTAFPNMCPLCGQKVER